jgi:hypothetical protein
VRRLPRAIGALAIPLLLIAGCSSGSLSAVNSSTSVPTSSPSSSPSRTPSQGPNPAPPPTPAAPPGPATDPLTGGAVIDGPVLAAKIDNTSAGLPHYGVADADIVYVEQVEGGLTRLMAVYHTTLPTEVGAVRSVRTTDAELLPIFGVPALVFSGGGGIPLRALAATSVVAVSEESGAGGFWRSDEASAPYNLHANIRSIADATSGLTPAKNIGLIFAATDPRVDAGPGATSVAVQYQAAGISFSFADGNYELTSAGNTDASGTPSYISHTVGSGTFTLYRDGHSISGTWSRPTPDQPTQYLDAAGQPAPFKPGKTWVALVPPVASVSVS